MIPAPGSGPAFITGGSSGIGLEVARQLAQRGQDVALFARGVERLDAAKRDIETTETVSSRVEVHAVDVSDASATRAAIDKACASLGVPTYLVTSAGIAEPGLFVEQPLAAHRQQMEANYFGSLNLIHPLTPLMRDAGGGRVCLVSSGAAFFGIYGYGAYGPSKFAIRGLAETLQVELAEAGIAVTLCYPPDCDTPQLKVEQRTKPAVTKEITASGGLWQPEAVARRIIAGMDRGAFSVAPGLQMTLLNLIGSTAAPALRFYQRRVARRFRNRGE